MKREENKSVPADLPAAWRGRQPLPADAASAAKQKAAGPMRKWLLLALVFFLISIIFIVPAGHIPLLRNVSWRMGFSVQETRSMSFFRTLLVWVSDAERRSRQGNWSGDGGGISLFDRQTQPELAKGGPASGLFNMKAVNADRAARGLAPDGVYGVYSGRDENLPAVSRPMSGWSAEARRAVQQSGQDVYFGADADTAARVLAGQTAASSDTAALVPSAGILGAADVDSLQEAVRAASASDRMQLDSALVAAMPRGTFRSGSWTDAQKPQQDLDAVWLSSLAADQASDAALKKKLAVSGYMGGALPADISAGTVQGAAVGSGRITAGFESSGQLRLREERCRQVSAGAGDVIRAKLQEAEKWITALYRVPKTCRGDMQSWSANLRNVKVSCQELKAVYTDMERFCGLSVTGGRCEAARLDSYESSYNEICAGYDNLSAKEKSQRDERLAEAAADIDYEIKDSFNLSVGGEKAGGNDFFPVSRFE